MLKRLRLRNFLSFREESVEFGKVSVFIGPNASGKSNIVKALKLLRNHFTYGVPIPDESRPGELPFGDLAHGFNVYGSVELEVHLDLGASVVYTLSLSSDGYEERTLSNGENIYSFSSRSLSGHYKVRDGTITSTSPPGHQSVRLSLRTPDGLVEAIGKSLPTSILRSPPPDADESLVKLSAFFRSVGVFRFSPDSIRLRSSVSAPPVVGYDGSNLARFILHLYLEKRKLFASVEEAVKSLVPEVEEIVPHIEGNEVEIWIKSKDLPHPLRPDYISDGTLRLIALVTVLSAGFSLVAIEEPENYIHPHLLEAVADLARKSRSQIVITTHSPRLLDFFKPEEVYVVAKVGAETRVRRLTDTADFEIVRRFLEEGGTLGEAWISRFFGE